MSIYIISYQVSHNLIQILGFQHDHVVKNSVFWTSASEFSFCHPNLLFLICGLWKYFTRMKYETAWYAWKSCGEVN